MKPVLHDLVAIFGRESSGDTPEECARTSKRMWVRSQTHLNYYSGSGVQSGLVLTAVEALQAFGFDFLLKLENEGHALITRDPNELARTIRSVRESKGLSQEEVAERARVAIEEVIAAETPRMNNSMRVLTNIARALGLNPASIGYSR